MQQFARMLAQRFSRGFRGKNQDATWDSMIAFVNKYKRQSAKENIQHVRTTKWNRICPEEIPNHVHTGLQNLWREIKPGY